ncbi:UNVERIFIED_CONTAM: hypothetical protein K2H54_046021 [Gekko kuhli]
MNVELKLSVLGVWVFVTGDLQQLLIVPDPSAAAQYCQHYMPDCNRPLTYALHAQYAEEFREYSRMWHDAVTSLLGMESEVVMHNAVLPGLHPLFPVFWELPVLGWRP